MDRYWSREPDNKFRGKDILPARPSMGISVVVEADDRGRILLPLEKYRKFKTKRFKITAEKNSMELEPLKRVEELK